MKKYKNIKLGIGFATGRKSFKKVLNTYVYTWIESGIIKKKGVSPHLLVAYDLKYANTKPSDYTCIKKDLNDFFDDVFLIPKNEIMAEAEHLIKEDVINRKEARFFGSGYSSQRNAIMYTAIKNNLDYLLFLDDDEYPMAAVRTRSDVNWCGQRVLGTHLYYIGRADITHGYHCGYISPIPYIEFNSVLTENDFRTFIEAISNDIISWDSIKTVMKNGGITYAEEKVLIDGVAREVKETNNCKFISGGNLCINLTDPIKVRPFYNPPGARGEDTFFSTCLSKHRVLKVPCYTFHDGFSTYNHLLDGVLPTNLKRIRADSNKVISRFFKACLGWIRYKPLLLYITQRDEYHQKINKMRQQLAKTVPKICAYFNNAEFKKIITELELYHNRVEKHYAEFLETQRVWSKVCDYLAAGNSRCTV